MSNRTYQDVIEKLCAMRYDESLAGEMDELQKEVASLLKEFSGMKIASITLVPVAAREVFPENQKEIRFSKESRAYNPMARSGYPVNLDVMLSDVIVADIEKSIIAQQGETGEDTENFDDSLRKVKQILGMDDG